MKKIIKTTLKLFISPAFLRQANKKIKILRVHFLKILEYLNIYYFSDPYRDTYQGGKIDKNYKSINTFINFDNGIYFEIGALDGYFSSPTYKLSVKNNWKGVLVDGNLKYFDLLKLYRPRDEIIHAACASFETSEKNENCSFLDLHHSGEIIFSEEKIDKWAKQQLDKLGKEIVIENTPLTNVTHIVEKSNIISNNHIDLFVLDVEGHEQEVLDGYDFEKIETDYFLIESRTSEEFDKIKEFMQSKGYNFIGQTSSTDFLYKRK